MKLIYIYCLTFLLSVGISAQKRVIKEDVGIQTYLDFDNPLPKNEAISAFEKKCKLEKNNIFEPNVSNTDKAGNIHLHHQQYFNGLKVEFGTLITHANNEGIYAINGETYNASNLNLIPNLTKQQGLNIIMAKKQSAIYMWENNEEAKLMHYSKPEGELLILPNVVSGEINLAYKYDVYSTQPLAREDIYVDAHTGVILLTNPIIKHANGFGSAAVNDETLLKNEYKTEKNSSKSPLVAGTATTKYSGSRSIQTTFDAVLSKYKLHDLTRGGGIKTYNNERKVVYQNVDFKDTDNNWTTTEYNNTNKDIGALDAHWGAMMTYDFWQNIFGRNSYDNLGTQLTSYVHYRKVANTSLVNAFWNGTAMSYGDGSTSVSILTSIDVCGHEIGHAVCASTANLVYQNQSGGINEGYSDIWGACIEHYGRTGALTGTPVNNVWLIAEDLSTTPFRSMKSPTTYGDPDTYLGTNWIATGNEATCVPSDSNDYCGVHTNSGVLNHWFYILTAGKSGTNNAPVPDTYNVTGIGMVKSAEIAFLAERDYLTPNATYLDVRNATLRAASTLYCGNSPEYIAVTNAWYAVNVGEIFVNYPNDIALKKVTFAPSVVCGVVNTPVLVLENTGTNTITSAIISYTIDGGTSNNTTWTGNLGTCQTANYSIPLGTLSRGTHSVVITTSITNDGNVTNNTKTILVTSNSAGTVNQINTFESAADNLISYDLGGTNSVWQRGQASGSNLDATIAQNSNVYGTVLNGFYPNKTTSYLVSQCYDLTSIQNPLLKFDMAFDFENNWDLLYMQYSINGGNSWDVLGSASDANWYTSSRLPDGTDCFNCIGAQWTGEATQTNAVGQLNGERRQYSKSLTNFGLGGATPQANILFRFVFQSDDATQNEGAIIDNFSVTGTSVLSNQDYSFNQFSVIPNPSTGIVTVAIDTNDKVNLTLIDMSGRQVYNHQFENNSNFFNQEINLGLLQKGVYLLTVNSDEKIATKKIIIN